MIIIGVDFHPEFQQIALLDTDDRRGRGKTAGTSRRGGEVLPWSRECGRNRCASAWRPVGTRRWFERLVAELQFELWIGDAAEIRAKRVRKQKTDRQDAQHILKLMLKDDFPKIWVPSWENRDLRQLLWHRHRMVQARTRIMNQLQAVALNEGLHCKKKLWRERGRQQLESFALAPWASRRRRDLLDLLDRLNPIDCGADAGHRTRSGELPCGAATENASWSGRVNRAGVCAHHSATRSAFSCGKQVASYLGLVPLEDSSGNRRRLGHITKQGSSIVRFLLVEAAQVTVRSLPEWRSKYFHLVLRRGRKIAKVAMARRLAVQLFWMMRKEWNYEQLKKFGSHAGQPGNRHGVQSNTE